MSCQQCTPGFTTIRSGSATTEVCVEPPPGSSLSKENTCSVLCPVGTYQPDVQKSSCWPCPSDSRPASLSGRNAPILAVRTGNNQTISPTNANCLFMASTNRCECKSAFTLVPPDSHPDFACMDRCDNFCKNDGQCRRDETNGQGFTVNAPLQLYRTCISV